ncbi:MULTISPECIES: STAS domain-containing protein [Methanoculleus]|jgi:anti-anti-sigma factor|uniref:Anti-anti-sigma factor n=1 Tax=Methanoculleus thermophilus TaxID=2200 RepID=A0A1G9AXC6_9EURY|nr:MULTISPECIES: STAS domain-containing protein [Methanoculleus]NLN09665.1 STAS domain-containing protein [Methanoculleus thermophilus]SDK31873.1 anti-anti-sigma factor [Methanoculleus thermophilus]HQD25328.1 STAS domain-containing protein [Methanoculleus thermophilus]
MELQTERKDGILTFCLRGRLDGYGAGQLADAISASLQDDDRSVVFDLAELSYLSSAGIRVLVATKKQLKERGGILALAGIQDYPKSVLDMAGVTPIFSIYAGVEEAIAACKRPLDSLSVINEITRAPVVRNGVTYTIERASTQSSSLRVVGRLDKMLRARLTEEDIRAIPFSALQYSLGIGALGKGVTDALPLLGEMITLHGSVVWLPTDGNATPDFFTPVKDTGELYIYTGYNVALNGPFHEIVTIDAGDGGSIALSDVYRTLFELAREQKRDFAGIIALAMWAVVDGVRSLGVKKSPIAAFAPENGLPINSEANVKEWLDDDDEPKYHGDTMVSFGFGVDYSACNDECLSALTDLNRPRTQQLQLHNHGVIFRGVPWDAGLDLTRQIEKILSEAPFIDMRHLKDSTRIRRAKVGVAYISRIDVDA